MDFPRRKLLGCKVSSRSSYSSEIDDEVSSRVFKGEELEERFIDLQREWNVLNKSTPRRRFTNRHNAKISTRIPISYDVVSRPQELQWLRQWKEFQYRDGDGNRELIEASSGLVDCRGKVGYLCGVSVGKVGYCCGASVGYGCRVVSVGNGRRRMWRALMMAICVIIMFALGFVLVTCSRFDNDDFLVPT